MFVALKAKNRSRVTSIAPQWDDRLNALRELTNTGQLICPGCEQPLWSKKRVELHRGIEMKTRFDKPKPVEQMILLPFQSGAEATALQTLARLPGGLKFRGASGVRRVHRRSRAHDKLTSQRGPSPARKPLRAGAFQDFGADVGGAERLGLGIHGAGDRRRKSPGGALLSTLNSQPSTCAFAL